MDMNNRAAWQEINKRGGGGAHSGSHIIYSSEASSHFCLIPSLAFLLAPRRLKVYTRTLYTHRRRLSGSSKHTLVEQ